VIAFGYSAHERLPYAPQEAAAVAGLFDGQALTEAEATLAQLHTVGTAARVLHLATHGDFNPDNPLFSGLTLADGQLSTLDIFNLRLQASLVTLSACQTGRSVIKGGDELLGLMRAFLYAGAASVMLSYWRVADQSTMALMQLFYQYLAQNAAKGHALRQAQCDFIHSADARLAHPYSWASFFLVGDTGLL
jgi:CHAT domain-containing protein